MNWQHLHDGPSPSDSSSDLAQPATPSTPSSNFTVHSPTEADQSLPSHTNPLWPPLPRVGTPFSSTMSNLGPAMSSNETDTELGAALPHFTSSHLTAQAIDVIEAVRQLQRLSLPLNNHGAPTGPPPIPTEAPPLVGRAPRSFANHPTQSLSNQPSPSTKHTNPPPNYSSHYANLYPSNSAEPVPVTLTSSAPIEKHPVYYFEDGNMDFKVRVDFFHHIDAQLVLLYTFAETSFP